MSSINTDKDGNVTIQGIIKKAGHTPVVIAASATPVGSDAGTTQTLANALQTKLNALIAELKAQGVIATS